MANLSPFINSLYYSVMNHIFFISLGYKGREKSCILLYPQDNLAQNFPSEYI